ncbi:hypothetical protein [Morganella morganii IS15]|nr:hypothetical protein CSB69_1580 [Morganella morganii]EMP53830.1 hypothetical protein C790_00348 [Morganella morganii SC01]CDK65726.1 hypothetical protein [Morganella morganii IS15]
MLFHRRRMSFCTGDISGDDQLCRGQRIMAVINNQYPLCRVLM